MTTVAPEWAKTVAEHIADAENDPFLGLADAGRRLGLTERQLDHWVRRGFIRTAGPKHPGSGRGRERRITTSEFAALERLARLVDAGLTLARADEVAHSAVPGQLYRIGAGMHVVVSGPETK